MSIYQILALSLLALLAGWALPRRWSGMLILVASLLAVFWLQPSTPLRNLDFWLPVVSISLTLSTWAAARPWPDPTPRATLFSLLGIIVIILAVALTRYLGPICCLTASRPPAILQVSLGLLLMTVPPLIFYFLKNQRISLGVMVLLILAIFVILKMPAMASGASSYLRVATGQPTGLASAQDLLWLGFSYLAFRLLHVLRDKQAGKLPAYSLSEFVSYALFFPAYPAGPIDRSQRFIGELQRISAPAQKPARQANLAGGAWRIILGLFKKFVLADGLALIALNSQNAAQVASPFWTWILLFAFSWRIYFDFSGYTDIAIGMGQGLGIHLPENFAAPYFKSNLTAFWNSWHITLAQWFRAYYFNPLTRWLRSRPAQPPAWIVILIGQFTTMLLIGLWHGITWNFAIWGAWHGLGLFIHNRWSDWSRPHFQKLHIRGLKGKLLTGSGWLLTFVYVSLGWVWFALPTPADAWMVFQKLAGF
jgi:alginate O-acetyltransferase complex protein AlgI